MRDKDFMREMLLEAASEQDNRLYIGRTISPDPETKKRLLHAELFCDQFLMEEINDGVFRMTSAGFDAVEAIEDATVWKKMRSASPGEAYEILKGVGSSVAVQALSRLMGWN